MDSELDKPSKPNWGSICRLAVCCYHCYKLERGGECLDQPIPKVTTEIVSGKLVESAKCMMRSRCMVSVKYVVDENLTPSLCLHLAAKADLFLRFPHCARGCYSFGHIWIIDILATKFLVCPS